MKVVSGISAAAAGVSAALTKIGVDAAAEVRAETSAFEQTFGDLKGTALDAIGSVGDETGILQTRLNTLGSKIYAFARASGGDATESMSLMERALRAAADSAAYYDTSVEEATQTLQSFLKGNFENDAALGLSATETTRNAAAMELFGQKYNDLSEIQKQETLLKMVEDAQALSGAAGQAAREMDGWENVTGNLSESWRQLKARFGEPILDTVTPIIKDVTAAVQNLTENVDWEVLSNTLVTGFQSAVSTGEQLISIVQSMLPIIEIAIGSFVSLKAGMAIQSAVQGFQQAQVAVSLLSMNLNGASLAQAALNGTMTVGETIVALLTGKMSLAALAQEAMTKAQAALNAVMNANPIAIVITVIGALVTALLVLWNTNEDFRNAVISAWEAIRSGAETAFTAVSAFFTETIPEAFQSMLDWLSGKIDSLVSFGEDVVDSIEQGIANAWDGLVSWFEGIWDSLFGNRSVDVSVSGSGGTDGSHAGGLDYVPYNGYIAELHRGETVLTASEAEEYRRGSFGSRVVQVVQHIYSEAKTAADLMEEARYEQEKAVILGV